MHQKQRPAAGLSPRVRGNRREAQALQTLSRSIPARAGEPRGWATAAPGTPVYPRACGGTSRTRLCPKSSGGLSPRVRGNPYRSASWHGRTRSIPARAGEPTVARRSWLVTGVYPRACGGTPVPRQPLLLLRGLSPRVRGNRPLTEQPGFGGGSIPARAGEPWGVHPVIHPVTVYPRACGGTALIRFANVRASGLSPRVRGNHQVPPLSRERSRSIPARAGEPLYSVSSGSSIGVYPRACGGTWDCVSMSGDEWGLSPRVRGNRQGSALGHGLEGSIPARAGEPVKLPWKPQEVKVYPRACGGTTPILLSLKNGQGLSPRVRGTRFLGSTTIRQRGLSPRVRGNRLTEIAGFVAVYPRACGGTKGNRFSWSITGSIPARAGEP